MYIVHLNDSDDESLADFFYSSKYTNTNVLFIFTIKHVVFNRWEISSKLQTKLAGLKKSKSYITI